MSNAFSSGGNTVDKPAEEKINRNGFWIFVGILMLSALLFTVWALTFNPVAPDGGQQRQSTESERAQP